MSEIYPTITGIILAGGRARRMDERDKGLIELEGQPLIRYAINALSPQVDQLMINANRNTERYGEFGFPVISDQITGFLGPLAGMAAAIQKSNSDYILSVPCDTPWVPVDLANRMFEAIKREGAELCVAHDGERMHPVFALINRNRLTSLTEYLSTGERAVHRWCKQQHLAIADFSDQPNAFINVNTPEELTAAAEIIKSTAVTKKGRSRL